MDSMEAMIDEFYQEAATTKRVLGCVPADPFSRNFREVGRESRSLAIGRTAFYQSRVFRCDQRPRASSRNSSLKHWMRSQRKEAAGACNPGGVVESWR